MATAEGALAKNAQRDSHRAARVACPHSPPPFAGAHVRRCRALHSPSPHVLLSRQRAEPSLAAHCVPRRLRTHICRWEAAA